MKILKVSVILGVFLLCFSFNAYAAKTSAKSAVLINADTFSVLYNHNMTERLPMASTTKIMTALILAEQNTPQKTITVTENMVKVEGSSMGLRAGDTVTYQDLLYGILLPSGNDAANAAAISVAGTIEKFALLMNKKVAEFGLHNTNFVTPSGLDANGHFTTAYDLAVIAANALKNKDFAKAASSYTAKVKINNTTVTLKNHNKLLKIYDGAIGVKTGFTKASGRCLVSAAKKGNTTLIAVTLNDKNDWQDHSDLLDYGFSLTKETAVAPKADTKISVLGPTDSTILPVFEPLIIGTTPSDDITYKVVLPGVVFTPVKKGDTIGYTLFYANGKQIGKTNITSGSEHINTDNKQNIYEKLFNIYKTLLRSL